ncbi:hypothetical protein DFH07DRAFT_1055325 [Mycena maculata]|uniref:WD40 repeat-like protein n=1 Tax=Mycena maculata TaxID=230809 RepID=A0AAD7KCG1_9AGAR|nr:hypothetical protein DFH07DRAFT_1055325 [Mycena maculata]
MRDLPGFYFDPARNRYFPLASRPPPTSTNTTAPEDAPTRQRPIYDARMSTSAAARARAKGALLHARLAHTGQDARNQDRWPAPAGARVCAFATTEWLGSHDGEGDEAGPRQWIGDARGWVYSRALRPSHDECGWDDEYGSRWADWTPELCLHPDSEVTSLLATPTRLVGVCFGPATKIGVQDAGAPGRTALLSLTSVRDVRAASLQGGALVLGAARAAILLPDLDAAAARVRTLATGSDVFAVAQCETLIYAGTRAGAALRFDTRVRATAKPHSICDSAQNQNGRSTAAFVRPTRGGRELVVGFTDGRLGSYDLRFVRPAAPPIVVYGGHVGGVGERLGTTLDPDERFLFAAGADRRLRAWALGSGAPVVPSPPSSSPSSHASTTEHQGGPFAARFPAPLAALHVTADALWAGGGGAVWRWRMGV